MSRRIIIPAAGDAVRYGGIPKELLPISETDCSLTNAVKLAQGLGDPVIISNPHKEYFHRKALDRAHLICEIVVRQDYQHKDLWGSIERGLELERAGGLILADTVTLFNAAHTFQTAPLEFGIFETKEPERFSIVTPEGIYTKHKSPPGNQAWGMMLWNADVTNFLLGLEVDHYDRAFESAMHHFNWKAFPLSFYHDLGTFKAYREFLEKI
jgi:hypothetical protein